MPLASRAALYQLIILLLLTAPAAAQTSPDGTTIAGGAGSLTNAQGTWSFGDPAPGRPGEWWLLLNNSNTGGIGAELEIDNGSNIYTLTAYGNWWVWSGSWVPTDIPPPPPLSPDGAVISDGVGTLTTAAGTWSFGAEANGRPGEWLILLNGDASNGGISTSLEIAAGGQVYAQTANGSWWVDLNGHGWMRTDAPPATTTPPPPPSSATLMVTCNPQMAVIPDNSPPGTVVSIVTATWSDGAPFTGSFMFAPPYGDDGGRFVLSCVQCDVANVMINPRGPGLAADTGTTRSITIAAIQ